MNTNIFFTSVALLLITINVFAQNIITVGDNQFKNENGVWFQLDGDQAYQVVENRITIKYYSGVSEHEKTSFSDSVDFTLYYHDTNVDYYVYYIPENEVLIDILISLQNHELIKIAEAQTYGIYFTSWICTDPLVSDDPLLSDQWYLSTIGADCAWKMETGKSNVIVALLDTGIDHDHKDIGLGDDGYQIFEGGWNFTYGTGNTMDLCPDNDCHGTQMAGIIAAKTNNGEYIAGIAGGWSYEGVKIMPFVNVDITTGDADPQYTIWSIEEAITAGAKIINMSFGSAGASYMDDVLEWAYEQGVLLIASAGNYGPQGGNVKYPARHPDVIAVGATDQNDAAWFTASGEDLELTAPGKDIYTTDFNNSYISINGSSPSAAIVSGVAALIWTYNPCFYNEDVRQILRNAADKVDFEGGGYGYDPNNPGHSTIYGYGRVNAYQALLEASEYFPDIVIDDNTTWIDDELIRGNLVIESNATLTINTNVEFEMHSKIIVKQGAKLIVNGGTLTNATSCEAGYWQGIEVWGNKDYHQWPDAQGYLAQGYLELNDAIIENAIDAVSLWKPGVEQTTGGIVIANNTKFINNKRSVHAINYENYDPFTERKMNNRSSFTRCTFEIKENYPGVEKFSKHVDLDRVDGVKFMACNFLLSPIAPNVSTANMAIGSYSAGFSVNAICADSYIPCQTYDHSTFTGFHWAINANNTLGSTRTFFVNQALFNGNAYGIYTSGINNFTVLNSEFHIGYNEPESDPCAGEGKSASGFGIHMAGCTGFAIEENKFYKASGAPTGNYTGILIAESQSTEQVYRNTFEGLSYGNYAVGINWETDYFKGLAYFCNENTGNYADFFVEPDGDPYKVSGIQSKQGDDNFVTGNTFTSLGNTWHFFNGGDYLVGYYYCNYCDDEIPDEPKTFQVTDKPKSFNNNCPSHYGGGGGSIEQSIVLTTSEKQEAELEFAVNLSNYNGVKALYDDLKDGGNTDAVIADIENAWPTDTWELRAELLGKSPHLSMEVLKAAADKTDVLPESIIFEVLAANPDELKKEELIKYLEDKADPLPEYMVNILRHLANGTTYKTILEQHMAHYNQVKTRAAYDIVRSLLNDTISDPEQLRNWLDNVGGKRADEQIIATYLAKNNYTNALALANIMPSLYAYSGNELTEHSFYMDLLNQQINLEQQQRSIFNLDSLELANLIFIAENSQGTAGLQARGILEYAYGHHFCNCLNISDMSGLKRSGSINPDDLAKLHGVEVNAHPNPASQWVAFNYTLPANAYQGEIKIVDAKGAEITSFTATGAQGQQIWDTRAVKPGVYFYTLSVGEFTKTGKLLINK